MHARLSESGLSSGSFSGISFHVRYAKSSTDDGPLDVFILKDSRFGVGSCDMKESSTSSDQERYVNQ